MVFVIVVGNLVLFVEFLVELRQNHLFPKGSVEQPDQDYVLNDGPTQFGHDVGRVNENAPGFFPNRHFAVIASGLQYKCLHVARLRLIDNECQ